MGRARHCSEEQSALIKMLIGEGKTYKEVWKMIGCSAKMISNALKCKAKPGRCGSKWKNTIRIYQTIAKMAKMQPISSFREIREGPKLPVSSVTIRKRLCKANLSARSLQKRPTVKKKRRAKKDTIWREHIDWPKEKWRNIL